MIKLKINVNEPSELLSTLMHLANGLLAGASQGTVPRSHSEAEAKHDPVMPEVAEAQAQQTEAEADKPKRTRRTKEQIAADEAAAKAAEGNVANNAEISTEQPAVETALGVPSDATDTSALDFDKDVAPTVLRLVKERGKPWVLGILNQFGVERASELPADRWAELVQTLEDADAA